MGFPHALGKPHPLGALAEMLFTKIAHSPDLIDTVLFRNSAQKRFIVPTPHDFDLTRLGQNPQPLQKTGLICLKPIQQRTGKMLCDPNIRIFFQHFNKWKIGLLKGHLENILKIADRLVGMTTENKSNRFHGTPVS